jgi:GAF domain-containing protein
MHPPAFAEGRRLTTGRPGPQTPTGRVLANKKVVHIADLRAEKAYADRDPWIVTGVELGRVRTVLIVPMLKENELIGAFSVYRQKVQPFSDTQIELSKNFAAQAVIAIENARLLNELRDRTTDLTERTADLTEALEQQTATSEVLQVISSSPGDLEPVFAAMLENAVRICGATFGNIYRRDGEAFTIVASHNAPLAFVEALKRYPSISGKRMLATKSPVHVADATTLPVYAESRDPEAVAAIELGGVRTFVAVPMLKDDEVIGAFLLNREEVRPFTDKQIELVQNFAAQAVIAIENARLLNELRQRTTDLSEALEQQTATSDVLQIISSSPGDLRPVFETMLTNATRICEAKFGILWLSEGERFRCVALHNAPTTFADHYRDQPLINPPPGTGLRGLLETRQVTQVSDMTTIKPYIERDPFVVASVELGGYRGVLNAPMLKENELIGAISIYSQEVCVFSDKQIALVTNFGAQAVIAIENARLLNELRQRTTDLTERTADLAEALEQQTATSEVLQVISSSPGDLQPVFAAMVEKAVGICDAGFGNIYRVEGDGLRIVATHNTPPAFAEARKSSPYFTPGPKSPLRRMMTTKAVVHVLDNAATEAYAERDPGSVAAVELGGARTVLYVPLLKENELLGAFTLSRQEARAFTDKQIALVQNFAAQAVIAIENARLLNELRQRTSDLTESLEQQTATSEVLQVVSNSPGDLEAVFATILDKAVRICEATFGELFRWDGETFRLASIHNTPPGFIEERKRTRLVDPRRPDTVMGRALATNRTAQIVDLAADPLYAQKRHPSYVAAVELGGVRTVVAVPMIKDDAPIGIIMLCRQEVRAFTDKQTALVEHFAAEAVIAIENARLLKELRERTYQLETQSLELENLNQHLERRVADQVGEIERMSRLRRFLPPQVADLIVASGSEKQLESHRREITALFCDLRGFTGFTESADAEDVMALLRDYHAAIGEIIIKYNGTLERYAGDGVMVVFNDPVPVENPALQAVLMALELREAIGALTATWSRLGHEIGFGIGIAHGFATLGTIGFEGRFDYAAIGTVSNVASRLCDEAKPGQILISPRVLMKVENAVKVEPVGEFELKGIRRPLAAYNVISTAS